LVVAGGRHHDVARLELGFFERAHLTRVRDAHLEAGSGRELCRRLGNLLENEDLVPVVEEFLGDERADVAGARDRDPHQCAPASSGPTRRRWSSSSASTWTAKWSTSCS